MRFGAVATILVFMTASLAGCTGGGSKDVGSNASNLVRRVVEPASSAVTQVKDLAFAPVKIIDTDHAGGEPVILVTKKGTIIVSSHPGYTHVRGPDSDLVTSSTGQTFVWRSEDGGGKWGFVGLAGQAVGPRNAATSVSDPAITMRPDGGIILTSLQSLVAITVEISTDDGKTWSGQPLHGPPGVDRNWVAACNNQDVYQVYTGIGSAPLTLIPGGPFGSGGRWFTHSTDGGQTWLDQHAMPSGGNMNCDQVTDGGKYLYINGGPTLYTSSDKGKTWKATTAEGHVGQAGRGAGGARDTGLSQPAIDAAGNVYTTWIENGTVSRADGNPGPRLFYAVSTDHGQSFARVVEVDTRGVVNGTHLWPWITAQDAGHIAIVFYGTTKAGSPSSFDSSVNWFVYSAIIPDALSAEPTAYLAQASNLPIHKGPICTSGTTCQADPNQTGDRRLGDFFTATFDQNGALLIATASTQSVPATGPVDGGGLAHPAFIKQIAGPSGLESVPSLGGSS